MRIKLSLPDGESLFIPLQVISFLSRLSNANSLFSFIAFLLMAAFQLWMLVDAARRKEWIWLVFMLIFPGLTPLLYFFLVYRSAPTTQGFELPGANERRTIKELEAKIHHLDKAHHYSQLGDVYFQQGKLQKAETCYRAAMERDSEDLDTRSHLGQCLLRQKKLPEARALLEGVVAQNANHEYGHTMMALAETLTALGETDAALNIWRQVTESHSYPRAKVQLAELYLAKNRPDLARTEIEDVLSDAVHAPAFQRKRDRAWFWRAKSLMGKLK